jgi:LacI family transcriptional regulator
LVNNDSATGVYTSNINLPEEMPTGFVCHCEMAAYYLKLTLDAHELCIPEDVSIVAFDNTEIKWPSMEKLVTFNIGRREIAEKAFRIMLGRISGDKNSVGRHYVQSFFVEGASIKNILAE